MEVTMKRRKSSPRRDWRIILFLIISALIVLTMILAYLPIFTGPN
jgi:predicted nucleic acid-binding Zn ribbon protein